MSSAPLSSAPHHARPPADFAGMAALVTGGGSGIGAATAALLLARGAKVAVLDRDPSGAPPGRSRSRPMSPPTTRYAPPSAKRWGSWAPCTLSSATPASAPSARSRTTTTRSGPGSWT